MTKMISLSHEEDLPALLSQSKILLLQFGTRTCAPCEAIKQRIDQWLVSYPEIVTRYISIEDFPRLAAEYGVFSAPTLLVFVFEQLTIRESGYFSLEDVLQRLRRYIELTQDTDLDQETDRLV